MVSEAVLLLTGLDFIAMEDLVECVLEMQAAWCTLRECRDKPDLLSEDHAVYEALTRFEELDYQGGGIIMEGKVEAFSIPQPESKYSGLPQYWSVPV